MKEKKNKQAVKTEKSKKRARMEKKEYQGRQRKKGKSQIEDSAEERLKKRKRGNRQIIAVTYLFVAIFIGMTGYLLRFMIVDSQRVINNPYNKRQELMAQKTVRGSILSADGEVLARTVTDGEGKESRVYPKGRTYCHVVGRTQNSMTGLEKTQSFSLLTSNDNPITKLFNEFQGKKNQGDTVVTTLQDSLQQIAYDALGNHKGAVVAIEPSTGKILAMVSKPDYDPNTVLENWKSLIADSEEESALLNRASQGLYPPGSTFKILTALEYMKENPNFQKYTYCCQGNAVFEGCKISCYDGEVHGEENLAQSLAHSCNVSFSNIGMQLDINSYRKLCEKFRFNKALKVDFEYSKSRFSLQPDADAAEVVQTAIGQGKTMITPLENCLISATIANQGKMMVPYLVDRIENVKGQSVKVNLSKSQAQVLTKKEAKAITRMMKKVVTDGTAYSLRNSSYSVAGKTGTAEYDSEGNSHAWFVGFAPANHPKIAVSVVVEGAGTGSQYAVPIAGKMFDEYLNK